MMQGLTGESAGLAVQAPASALEFGSVTASGRWQNRAMGGYVIRWRPSQELVVLVSYAVGLYMSSVDNTIIYTALPTVARDFHEPLAAAQWVTLSYLLALAMMIPSSGWIGDRFGTRRTYLAALMLFTGASVLCGLSGSLTQLVIFRVIQGAGAWLDHPGRAGHAVPDLPAGAPRPRGGHGAARPEPGPGRRPGAGRRADHLPFLAVVLFHQRAVRHRCADHRVAVLGRAPRARSGRLDIPGFVLAGGGLALVLYALSQAPVRGWGSPAIIATGAAGLAALAAMVAVELRSKAPMLNLRLLHNRIFRTTTLVSAFLTGAYYGYMFLMPEFLQQARGASALSSGLTTFPGAIGLLINAQIAARAYRHVGPRRMAVGGLCGVIAVFFLLGLTIGLDTSIWLIRLLTFLTGSAGAWSLVAAQSSSFATISPADTGRASALFQTQTQVAGGTGVAVLVTVVAAFSPAGATGATLVPAFRHAFLTAAAIATIAALIALTIRDADAAATMRRREQNPAAPPPPAAVPPQIQEGTVDLG